MEQKIFDEIYNDSIFRSKVEAMLVTMYRHYRQDLEDSSYDLEDFKQELWARLFEEKKYTPDKAWCFEAMRHNAIDLCQDCQRRREIAPIFDIDDDDINELELADNRDYSSADFPIRPRAFC